MKYYRFVKSHTNRVYDRYTRIGSMLRRKCSSFEDRYHQKESILTMPPIIKCTVHTLEQMTFGNPRSVFHNKDHSDVFQSKNKNQKIFMIRRGDYVFTLEHLLLGEWKTNLIYDFFIKEVEIIFENMQ